uniref:Uncharacterized protein n=2 Tax=viral metagenome TaxID=1070528 RepID=A0A6M3K0Q7_9ZZZZ
MMAFLHCHNCDFSQDDFYSVDGYNPPDYLQSWNKGLCGDRIDERFTDDAEFLREYGPITLREVIAREYEKYARGIRSMKWVTWESFKEAWIDGKWPPCPKCGKNDLDID